MSEVQKFQELELSKAETVLLFLIIAPFLLFGILARNSELKPPK